MLGVDVPFMGYNKTDTCKGKTVKCPLIAGHNYTFSDDIIIEPRYPKV